MSRKAAFVNDPSTAVDEAIRSYCRLHHEHVVRIPSTNVVVRRHIDADIVALVCGGGSGHEPAHIDFVRPFALTAAVCGNIFASPPITEVSAAIHHIAAEQQRKRNETGSSSSAPVATVAGILVLVKNYTGDVLNFGFAVREAKQSGIPVEMLVIGDDVAFGVESDSRRGIAGTVAWYAALGAAAASGMSLRELTSLGQSMLPRLRSFGISLSTCTIPGAQTTALSLDAVAEKEDDGRLPMSLGLGIHGERGLDTVAFTSAADCAERAVTRLLATSEAGSNAFGAVALLLNNLGGTTDLEMGVLLDSTLTALERVGVRVVAAASGRYMTALEMHGVSWTLIGLGEGDLGDTLGAQLLSLLLQSPQVVFAAVPTAMELAQTAPKAPRSVLEKAQLHRQERLASGCLAAATDADKNRAMVITARLERCFKGLATMQDHFNQLDAVVGDGDTGFGVSRAAHASLALLPSLVWDLPSEWPVALQLLAQTIADSFAGSSGPLYGAFLVAAAASVSKNVASATSNDGESALAQLVKDAFSAGCCSVQELGGAKVGERTMLDVLAAVVREGTTPSSVDGWLRMALERAEAAAKEVSQLRATKGRSRYLGGKEVGHPDPGAELVVAWLRLLQQ